MSNAKSRSKPLLKISTGDERRKIARSNFDDDPLLRAHIKIGEVGLDVQVSDFNSAGVGLRVNENDLSQFKKDQTVDLLSIHYGNTLLCEARNSKVVNISHDKMGIVFFNQGSRLDRKVGRLVINPAMEPIVFAIDPIEHHHLLHLKVLNISIDGLLASTSISNRNILPGVSLDKATLLLPGVGMFECDLVVKNIKVQDKQSYLGCQFKSTSKDFSSAIAKFALIGGENDHEPPEIYARKLKELNFTLRSVGEVTKLIRVSSKAQYDEMLRIRFDAYSAASKVQDGQTIEGMGDSYDSHSYNYIAIANGISMATFRLTVCRDETEKFPFEEYEAFNQKKIGFPREEVFEVSKLAILPEFQNTDIVVSLFRKVGIEGLKHKKVLCMLSTRSLRKLYFRIGAKVISKEYPHPTLPNDSLALLVLRVSHYMKGRGASAIAWEMLAKFIAQHFVRAGIKVKTASPLMKSFRANLEKFILKMRRR